MLAVITLETVRSAAVAGAILNNCKTLSGCRGPGGLGIEASVGDAGDLTCRRH